ncbi:hypothetical protein HO133_004001 [Letharia lupina]|uniref:Uncharacterized protein n=1 Tax=Letharia lupina TaxID=560253 RepID=A0A8H6F8T8_9LECA|nr:uncharacterized protein HO133_004001 [Letharia lupina]KAF6219532.1 hypothetical protein HO133_004001 [Letharia lupina]
MVRYLNPGGHDWAETENLDGYGISLIVVIVLYSIFFYAACIFLWLQRNNPAIRMRKIPLALLSILVLHVYLVIIFVIYPLNGTFPCGLEFWVMSMYLPIGIGLFQAQNQQLLIVSREQNLLKGIDELYRPLYPNHGGGLGGPEYWIWRLKLWWRSVNTQNKYEGLVFVGMVVQFVVSLVIYSISRQFHDYGIVSHHTSPGMCRKGWEWAPSIVWQFLWNFFFGPYLLWKIKPIHDIYHWRLQTWLSVLAGLPGTPLWIAAVYTDSFASVNKYWAPPMWFMPGLMMMELVTLIFPIMQVFKHNKAARETHDILAKFDAKKLHSEPSTTGSLATRSTGSKRGKMFSMESLDECLTTSCDDLQVYASCMELNGENIIFLTRVLGFQRKWDMDFPKIRDRFRARMGMFRAALSIYVTLVHSDTASYPINIESPIYATLESIFGAATKLVASRRNSESPSTPISSVTPWDEPQQEPLIESPMLESPGGTYPMRNMSLSTSPARRSIDNDSREHIIPLDDDPQDSLAGFQIPAEFGEHVFDAAFKSIKYMVWSETWQRYMNWKRSSVTVV